MKILLAALLVSGCASLGDIYTSEIDETIISDKPLAEVSSCYQIKYHAAPLTSATGEQIISIPHNQKVPLMVLTLSKTQEGKTRIDMRRPNSIGLVGDWRGCST